MAKPKLPKGFKPAKVSEMWEWLVATYPFTRVRQDRAVTEGSEDVPYRDRGEVVAIEIGYGSWTVRVRLIKGYETVHLWVLDVSSLPERVERQPEMYKRFNRELFEALQDLGVNPR